MIGRMGCYFENGKVKYWFKFASEITDRGFYAEICKPNHLSEPTRIIKMPIEVLSKCRFYTSERAWFAGDK